MTTKNIWIVTLSATLILIACASQKEVPYELPEGMPSHVKAEYSKRCDKGKILYDINCARCHDTGKGRKKVTPDFKPEQLTGYTLRTANVRHESSMPDSLVSEEELGIIMTFLNYKKKNIPVKQ